MGKLHSIGFSDFEDLERHLNATPSDMVASWLSNNALQWKMGQHEVATVPFGWQMFVVHHGLINIDGA
eukprot:9279091-Prorocentrum_lima.AAC.1